MHLYSATKPTLFAFRGWKTSLYLTNSDSMFLVCTRLSPIVLLYTAKNESLCVSMLYLLVQFILLTR